MIVAQALVIVQRVDEVRAVFNVGVVGGSIAVKREHLVVIAFRPRHVLHLVVPRHRVVDISRPLVHVCRSIVGKRSVY